MDHVYLNIVPTFSHNIKVLSCCKNHCRNIIKETRNSFFQAVSLLPIFGIIILSETLLDKPKRKEIKQTPG
jgi:hypothetical protein